MEPSILFYLKNWGSLVLFRRAPKITYFLRKSFYLWFREKSSQIKTFYRKVFFMFCLDNFSLDCIIKMLNLKVNDPLNCYFFDNMKISLLFSLFNIANKHAYFQYKIPNHSINITCHFGSLEKN